MQINENCPKIAISIFWGKNHPKMAQNAISDDLKFKIFLGGACPQTPLA